MVEIRQSIALLLLFAGGSVAACGSPTPSCSSSPGTVTWASVQPIFTGNCTSCHGGFNSPAGVSFASEASAAANAQLAVNAMSSGRMPPGGGVSDSDICKVQAWIDQGLKP
jgi:hypothetical protein